MPENEYSPGRRPDRHLITQGEAEKRWRTTRQTLWIMRKNGLPYYRLNTKILYDIAEVEAFIRRSPLTAP